MEFPSVSLPQQRTGKSSSLKELNLKEGTYMPGSQQKISILPVSICTTAPVVDLLPLKAVTGTDPTLLWHTGRNWV